MANSKKSEKRPIALVRGVGDVGSAIAWKLFHSGFAVVCHENRQPRTIRRKMAVCDALWDGEVELAGLKAVRIDRVENLLPYSERKEAIAVYSGPFDAAVEALAPDLIVDGRIQKFSRIEAIKDRAKLTIGVGPSFVAGDDVDIVVESCWGDDLGRVIETGIAVDPVPVPPRLNGIGWERFIRSEQSGRFTSELNIGDYVEAGDRVGYLDSKQILAPISGHLRGLLYPGLSVLKGEKLCEIDPRAELAHFNGLAERPCQIATGVLQAVSRFLQGNIELTPSQHFLNKGDFQILEKREKIS